MRSVSIRSVCANLYCVQNIMSAVFIPSIRQWLLFVIVLFIVLVVTVTLNASGKYNGVMEWVPCVVSGERKHLMVPISLHFLCHLIDYLLYNLS